MHIKKVRSNVKKGCDVELGPKTLVVGKNGSGKSTIVNSVELALTARVGDVAGRVDVAREVDVMSLAKDGAHDLESLAEFDDGVVAAYRTSGSTAKAKKASGDKPADRCHDDVLPIRTLREALLGSPATARKFLMGKIATTTYADVEALIPAALWDRFHQCMPANGSVADGLVAAIEYAAKASRDATSEAKTQREAAKLVSGGRGAPPTEAEVKNAAQSLKDARAKLAAIEKAVDGAVDLEDAEAEYQLAENTANEVAIKLTNARTALNAAKKPKALNPLLSHVCMVMDESVLAGECLACGGTAPSKAAANEISAAIADAVKANKVYDNLALDVTVLEARAEVTLEILDRAEKHLESLKGAGPLPTDADHAAAEKAVTSAESLLLDLRASRDSWLKVQQAESSALEADRSAVEWKALKEALENAMALTLEQSLAAFVAKVQQNLPGTDQFDLKLRDGDREVVSFGLVRGGFLHTALSGAEWARVMAAMSAACVASGRYACLIPEERAFDPDTLKSVMEALSGSTHQVILTSPVKPKKVPAGWTVIERGE
jgi:energy-coupling factor transporter ATP-binding protein EcfA2